MDFFTLEHCLVIFPLVFLAGFVDAVAGGGGLISLPGYFIAGLPAHLALGTNKLSSLMGTSLTTAMLARRGLVRFRSSALLIAAAFAGSFLGARAAMLLSARSIELAMLVVLPCILAYLLLSRRALKGGPAEAPRGLSTHILCALISLAVGTYDGMFGPGTGTFLILAFTGLAKLPLGLANGQAKAVNLATNISAFAAFASGGSVLFALGAAAGLFGIAGNFLGTRSFMKGGARIARPVMICVMAVFLCRVIWDLFLKQESL
ncbi:MAG: sulfite exporter TauE/SafE family protein [Succinivibrio sp.]